MEAEKWPGTGKVSESELLRRDQVLLEMWPEACRRTDSGLHEFPSDVINSGNKAWAEATENNRRAFMSGDDDADVTC